MPDTPRCGICGVALTHPTANDAPEATADCGGDCLRCMADAGDPDAMRLLAIADPDLRIGDEVRDADDYVGVVRNLGLAAWVVYPHTPGHGARAEWWPTSDLTPTTTDDDQEPGA